LLGPLGFEVTTASNGWECLTLAEQHRPDLILLDIAMPEMDGWEVARRLRQTPRERPAVLVLSANAIDASRLDGTQRLHDDYLMKPINFRQLLKKIHALLNIEWIHEEKEPRPAVINDVTPLDVLPPDRDIEDLVRFGEIGHVRQIHEKLTAIANELPECANFVARMRSLVTTFEIRRYLTMLEAIRKTHA
jgi:CheY-like chemotaxis protein